MSLAATKFSVILYGLTHALNFQASRFPQFAKRLKEKNFTAQIGTTDKSIGRYYTFNEGRVSSASGIHPKPDIHITVASAEIGARLFVPWVDQLERIEAMKNYQFGADGSDELIVWFTQTVMLMQNPDVEYGIDMGDGTKRCVTNTNGGPPFVYVKDGKGVRVTPLEFTDKDAPAWTIKARGKNFTRHHMTTV